MEYRGNKYSQLASKQKPDIYKQLVLQCHSLETLERNNVILDTSQPPEHIVKKHGLCIADFETTRKQDPSVSKPRAIAIACQVAKAEDGGSEPVCIAAIDFITGETLIDSFIAPSRPISDWRTYSHGISPKTIEAATKGHNCLQGWREARERLFEYVSAETVFVGYGIFQNLRALRVFHRGIVDAQILTMDAIFRNSRSSWNTWPIDKVCTGLLSMIIRQHATPNNLKHDALEDALAAREIVLHYLQWPAEVAKWGKLERQKCFEDMANKKETERDTAKAVMQTSGNYTNRKSPSVVNQDAAQRAKGNGNKRRNGAVSAKDSISQTLKELSIEEATQGSKLDKKQKGPENVVGKANDATKDTAESQEKSNGRSGRKARSKAKKKAQKEAQIEAQKKTKRETDLKLMVQEEELNLSRFGNAKQSARAHWEVKHRADRKAKWVEEQRDD
ncbi:hypothetical protein V8C42DRAFT_314158 [Trichoderma barbatum]